jgi:hypothetical protein
LLTEGVCSVLFSAFFSPEHAFASADFEQDFAWALLQQDFASLEHSFLSLAHSFLFLSSPKEPAVAAKVIPNTAAIKISFFI